MIKHVQLLLVGILILTGATHSVAQEHCNRHIESQGAFSICIPDGWTAHERQNEKYKILFGQSAENFAPNINFKEELSTLKLSDYVAAGIKNAIAKKDEFGATSMETVSQTEFNSASGMPGIRTIFLVLYKGLWVRSIQYCFDAGNNRKLIVTGTSLEKNKEVLDRVFDRAAKSFRLN